MATELIPLILARGAGVDLTTVEQAVMTSAVGAYIDFLDSARDLQGGRLILILGSDSAQNAGGVQLNILTSTENPYTGSGVPTLSDDMSTETASFVGVLDGHITVIGPLETANYLDTDGHINIEISTDDTAGNVYITALWVP